MYWLGSKIEHLAHTVHNFTGFIDPFDRYFDFIVFTIRNNKFVAN